MLQLTLRVMLQRWRPPLSYVPRRQGWGAAALFVQITAELSMLSRIMFTLQIVIRRRERRDSLGNRLGMSDASLADARLANARLVGSPARRQCHRRPAR